ncbi:MAG: Flp pilus assembly protein CpaB [Phycisphaerales bacterium]|nr:MAG: Flp pilus assembly protein CpaB [Phycisphaerales bacterium]
MKIAVIILVLLGLVAAGASAVVVQMLAARNAEATPMVQVVQAQGVIPALTPLKREHMVEGEAPPSGLPKGYLSSTAQAIGRVLRVPIEEGQVLAQEYFVPEGTASDMIRLIPPGMLAYSATLSGGAVNRHLLYPGCVVDILAVFGLSRSAKGQAVALTLLQNIQLVAIENETVLSHPALEGETKRRAARSSDRFVVTFKVDPEEAKALQLAAQYGRIAVALRNPTDTDRRNVVAMVLNQGQLSEWAQDLDPGALLETMREMIVGESTAEPNQPLPLETPSKVMAAQGPTDQEINDLQKTRRRMNWKVIFIEGTKAPQEINFSLEKQKTDN